MVTDKVEETTPAKNQVETFAITSSFLAPSKGLRLDASFYNPRVAQAIDTLRHSGLPIRTLGELTQSVFLPPRFGRIYVEKEHGIPFLQGSHVIQFQPTDIKYISRTAHKKIEQWMIKEGWILVTRSGTVGRVTIVPKHWHGWAASEHILRIIPKEGAVCPRGYLYSYLTSYLGQAQLTAQIYGAVVDELTEEQLRNVLVPVAETPEQQRRVDEINRAALEGIRKKQEAVELVSQAVSGITTLIPAHLEAPKKSLLLAPEIQQRKRS